MKCENCPASKTDGYDYPETICSVYGEDEAVEFRDGSIGCRHKLSTIEKKIKMFEEYQDEFYNGYVEWAEKDEEIENAVKEAVLEACDIENIIFACQSTINNELIRANMNKEIPSHLHDFVFRLRDSLDRQGFDIVKREVKNDNNKDK
jgi:hypothetical protein